MVCVTASKYRQVYDRLIDRAKARGSVAGYSETHHILPRSLGGDDSPENLVELTAREHLIAHLLLARITDSCKMWYAIHFMCHAGGVRINSRLFAVVRQKHAEKQRAEMGRRSREMWADPKKAKRMRESLARALQSPEHRRRRSKQLKEHLSDPENKKRRVSALLSAWKDPATRDRRIAGVKEKWRDPNYRAKTTEAIRAGKSTEQARRLTSEQAKARWADPAFKQRMKEIHAARRNNHG